ncbi:unnamed protein product [Linum tenue]|uniref:Uncharacterized protein n=1 Tax=Linum tenue TaxID=586396 RepID=A0AAV0K785_9ROSI|nr:unnamed protein product [Linum tenue]
MVYRNSRKFLLGAARTELGRFRDDVWVKLRLYHCSSGEVLPFEWYEKAFPKIQKLTRQLRNVDLIDGRAVNTVDDSFIMNPRVLHKVATFKSLVRVFIGSPLVQQKTKENVVANGRGLRSNAVAYFSNASEREPMIVDSLTKVGNFLNVSAQQRKEVRVTICPQVTHHRIWTGALQEVLNSLKLEMDCLGYDCSSGNMGHQIISSCLTLLADSDTSPEDEPTSWMRLAPSKPTNPNKSRTWEDVLEMVYDLIGCLRHERESLYHISKLEVMKEGLTQIKDVLVDKGIGYREARHQETLVQKKLSSTLGHSSRCLFTLLLYYLYGQVRDIEVDLCGGLYKTDDKNRFRLRMGRILTSDEEPMVLRGAKHLDRVLELFKFVWETAGMKGVLELEGHLFCVDAQDRVTTYRGNSFFVHGINF